MAEYDDTSRPGRSGPPRRNCVRTPSSMGPGASRIVATVLFIDILSATRVSTRPRSQLPQGR
jgi:hypothetical protein